jgi:hypothetical protein
MIRVLVPVSKGTVQLNNDHIKYLSCCLNFLTHNWGNLPIRWYLLDVTLEREEEHNF